jgi:TolB protein
VLIFVFINLIILGGLLLGISRLSNGSNLPVAPNTYPASDTPAEAGITPSPTAQIPTNQPTDSPTVQSTDTPSPDPITASPQPLPSLTLNQGLIILALDEGGNTHLFAYQPEEAGAGQPLPLTRLTYGPWDDITPAISPDGQSIAFSSNRNGYWDIYLLEINSGDITRLTDTLEYEAAPSWSPDNKWLTYEAYTNDNLEIWIQSTTAAEERIQLTNDPAADYSPAWSPDGLSLVWSSEQDGLRHLVQMELPPRGEANTNPSPAKQINLGSGDWPIWSTDGETILTILEAPNRVYLTAYRAHYPGLALPAVELPGPINGMTWGLVEAITPLQTIYQQAVQLSPTPLYVSGLTTPPGDNGERYQLSALVGVEAPHPYLHDMTDESFEALRTRIAVEAGWDFLSTLENAYVPLTSPLDPGMGNDWLYTGRAFAHNTLPIDASWLLITREDFGAETYWRVYVRPMYQDGSVGIPLHDPPWDFNARNNGNTTTYEQGGTQLKTIPPGYWIDFSARARVYGWERLPALTTWRAAYSGARFNEYVLPGGLDWQTAMLEIYPPEAMITPSPVVPPGRTLTPTPRGYVSPTPTFSPTPRPTLTPFQTATPIPGG